MAVRSKSAKLYMQYAGLIRTVRSIPTINFATLGIREYAEKNSVLPPPFSKFEASPYPPDTANVASAPPYGSDSE